MNDVEHVFEYLLATYMSILGKNVYSDTLLIFNHIAVFVFHCLLWGCMRSLYSFDSNPYQIHDFQCFLPFSGLPFNSVDGFLHRSILD